MLNEDKILYVEDDPADVELAMIAFRQSGISDAIHVARDGVEALDYLFCQGIHSSRNFVPPRFVLLDLKLPKVSGLEVLEAIRADKRTMTIPVVVLTSSKEDEDLVSSYRLGANSYIQKPLNFENFTKTVQHLSQYWFAVNQVPFGRSR